jgi:hypothetical protein
MQKLEEELAAARKVSSERQLVVTKVCSWSSLVSCCFYEEKQLKELIDNTHLMYVCSCTKVFFNFRTSTKGPRMLKMISRLFSQHVLSLRQNCPWDTIALCSVVC